MVNKAAKHFGIGFLVGVTVQFLTAVFAVLIDFDVGVRIETLLSPFTRVLVDRVADGLITIANGLLYGSIACLASLFHSAWRSHRT